MNLKPAQRRVLMNVWYGRPVDDGWERECDRHNVRTHTLRALRDMRLLYDDNTLTGRGRSEVLKRIKT